MALLPGSFSFRVVVPVSVPCIDQICYIYTYIYIKVNLATKVEGDSKAPFSIATTPRCRGGRYSFPWIGPLYS